MKIMSRLAEDQSCDIVLFEGAVFLNLGNDSISILNSFVCAEIWKNENSSGIC